MSRMDEELLPQRLLVPACGIVLGLAFMLAPYLLSGGVADPFWDNLGIGVLVVSVLGGVAIEVAVWLRERTYW